MKCRKFPPSVTTVTGFVTPVHSDGCAIEVVGQKKVKINRPVSGNGQPLTTPYIVEGFIVEALRRSEAVTQSKTQSFATMKTAQTATK